MLAKLKSSTLPLVIPALVVAAMIGFVIADYEPLMFDATLVQKAQAAQADQARKLKDRTATEEAEKSGAAIALGGGTPAPASAVKTAGAAPTEGLADGTWTGYAVCGQGNGDGWKPYYVAVTIQVENGKVSSITNISGSSTADSGASLSWDPAENQAYLDWAAWGRNGQLGVQDQINSALASGGSASGVDAVSGATYSSVAVYNAYVAAVNKAAAAGGAQTSPASQAANPASSSSSKASDKSEESKKAKDKTADDVAKNKLADGTWTGYAPCGVGNEDEWSPYYVGVTISVKKGAFVGIVEVKGSSKGDKGDPTLNWKRSENEAYLNWAAKGRTRGGVFYEGVIAQVEAAMGDAYPSEIDVVSGATYSSEAIFHAFYAALKKSAEAGGSVIDEPEEPTKSSKSDASSSSSSSSRSSSSSSSGKSSASSKSEDGDGSDDSGKKDEPGDPGNKGDTDEPGDPGDSDDPGKPAVVLPDGVYTGHAFCKDQDEPDAWSPYYILVDVEVLNGKVARVFNARADSTGEIDPLYKYDDSENSTYLDFAINGVGKRIKGMIAKMQEQLDAGADPSAVDVVSSATWSSKAIVEAYRNALEGITA